jgi:hypothetical protein
MTNLQVVLKLLPEQRCLALNKRRKPPHWESGIVMRVFSEIFFDKLYIVFYKVLLDRKTKSGKDITLTVLREEIVKTSEEKFNEQ